VTHVQPADGAGASSSSSSSIASAATLAQSNAAASGLTQESLRPPTPWLTPGNIVLALLWVLFIFMLLQIPSFSSENLAKVRSTTMTASGPFFFAFACVLLHA